MPSPNAAPVRPILFLHLPKTAGTTLKGIIEQVYPPERVAFLKVQRGEMESFAQRPQGERDAFDVVAGHMPWSARALLPAAAVITLLRDPLERVVSWFYYNLSSPNAALHAELHGQGITFERAVTERRYPGVYNQMVDMLRDPRAPDLRGAVASAKQHLAQCAAFGIAERFDDSVRHFSQVLRWPETTRENRNVTEGRPALADLDPAVIQRLRRDCGADVELYEFARRLFESRVGA